MNMVQLQPLFRVRTVFPRSWVRLYHRAMTHRIVFPILTTFFLATAAQAAPDCAPPPAVAAYLKAHPGWTPLTLADLNADQQALWNEAHKDACPGWTAVVLDRSKETSYALALLSADRKLEQWVLLKGAAAKPSVIEPPSQSTGIVVWRKPKAASGFDGFVYELFESASQEFYFVKGKIRKVQGGD